uniref:Multivesicular body subunit 12Bb n=1 Tax=Neogobius melanostomus TaxID=47308 RepID=A0A8C6V450_9GOBI
MTEVSSQLPAEPISAVGIVSSPSKAPDGYYVVAQTTDGSDADLRKDGLFKSKVTRYLCFSRNPGLDVVADVKLTDIKDTLPEGFTPLQETLDNKEAAMRKRRLCVKVSPRAAAQTAVYDIQIVAKSKHHLVNYTCVGEINNMFVWCRFGDVHTQALLKADKPNTAQQVQSTRMSTGRPDCDRQRLGSFTKTALDDVPFVVSEKFHDTKTEMQQVNLMGITIKSLAEIEEEFHYNFTTERSIVR